MVEDDNKSATVKGVRVTVAERDAFIVSAVEHACGPTAARLVREAFDVQALAEPGWRKRKSKLDRRDDLIRGIAATHYAELPGGGRAEAIGQDLARESALRTKPDTAKRVAVRRILTFGKPIGASQIRTILAGRGRR